MERHGRVTLAAADYRANELAPYARGGLDGLLWVFEQDDSSEHWDDFLAKAAGLGGEPEVTATFNRAETADAAWCLWLAEWQHGYPQPEDEYLDATYEVSAACPICHVGLRQNAPFRMRNEPRWGRRSLMQLYWVYDAWFVTPSAYRSVFQPFGIASRQVLRKSGRPLETVLQLVVEEGVPLAESRVEGELCTACGVFKRHVAVTDFGPPPAIPPPGPIAHSTQWYGSGGAAFHETLLRQDLVAAIYAAGLRGAAPHPCHS